MALTTDEQKTIADLINVLYAGTLPADPSMVTEEVSEMVTNVVNQIAVCSSRMQLFFSGLNELYSLLYKMSPICQLIKEVGLGKIVGLVSKWMKEIEKEFSVRSCTVTTLNNWKSPLEIALLGI